LYTRFGPETVTHNDVAFFGAKFPQLVKNSRVLCLAAVPVIVVVVQIFCWIHVQPPCHSLAASSLITYPTVVQTSPPSQALLAHFDPSGQYVAAGHTDSSAVIWDLETHTAVRWLEGHIKGIDITSVKYVPRSRSAPMPSSVPLPSPHAAGRATRGWC